MQTLLTSSDIVQELLSLIRAEGLVEGDRLPSIRQLSTKLGARPHVVRDALMQAQMLGYVKVPARSRAVVRAPRNANGENVQPDTMEALLEEGEHHLFHLLEARQLLEFEVVRQAAERRRLEDLLPIREALHAMSAIQESHRRPEYVEHDIRFHLGIARLAANPVLTAMLRPLLSTLRPFLCRLPFDADRRELTQRSHSDIYKALVAGDADQALARMQEHLHLAYDNLLGEIQTVPE